MSGDTTKRTRIVISIGDPNGVGPEVTLKCLTVSRLYQFVDPVVVGSARILRWHARQLGLNELKIKTVGKTRPLGSDSEVYVVEVGAHARPEVRIGEITQQGGRLAIDAVRKAAELCMDGKADAMVTAPISKEAISLAGIEAPGHTEFLAGLTGCNRFTMMMVSPVFRVGLVTGHIPLGRVPASITGDAIVGKLEIIHETLHRDFGIERPRIAVLGLNPHAGDGGVIGSEEDGVIIPAVKAANERGMFAFGPFAPDGFFAVAAYRQYDAVLAMYHDQGLIPFKAICFGTGVNFTAGLPIVRTSPDHGTAYDIAGRGAASPDSMRNALLLARDIVRQRTSATVNMV